ncbi:MAG: hypothetical protein E3K32_06300 [wastewater metagenome]|nr:hypothetical protein [Candidatus Loosdrechtia aerotolerans]
MQHVCIFEDYHYLQLIPLIYTRAVFELRCGLLTFLERICKYYSGATITLFCRDYLFNVLQEKYPYRINSLFVTDNTYLFVNGRAIFSTSIPIEGEEEIGIQDNTIIYARLKGENLKKVSPDTFLTKNGIELFKGIIPVVNIQVPMVHYFWDIISLNRSQIEKDFMIFVKEGSISGRIYDGAYFMNKDKIFIGRDSQIKPGCVLDAENGPIYIGDHVTIAPNTTIEGPVYVGNYSTVQSNSRLRGGTNVGEFCKIGGEIVNTIFHGYSNKQHDGFLGDSYVGLWVNMGASTVNSNLLNTYGNIRIQLRNDTINTGKMFLGAVIGDNTKTAINTVIMTGSVFGFACNIITSTYPPKYLPSFTWCSSNGLKVYTLEKALQVAKIVMKRRNKEMTQAEETLFKLVFRLTESERSICKEAMYGKRY